MEKETSGDSFFYQADGVDTSETPDPEAQYHCVVF